MRKKTLNLCVFDIEDREHGVGTGVNDTMMSETLEVVGLGETVRRSFWFRKKNLNLCVCDNVRRSFWLRKKTLNLCPCDNEDRGHGDECE